MMDIDAFVRAGLYDASAPDAAARLALLEHLTAAGATVAEMVAAVEEDRLAWLGVELMLATAVQGLTLAEVTARVGIDPTLIDRAQRSLGLPPPDESTYDEVALQSFSAAAEMFGIDVTLQFSRVLGSSLARVVEAAMSVFAAELEKGPLETESELDLAHRAEAAAGLLLALPTTMQAVFPAYVKDALRRARIAGTQSPGGATVAVGFVDLVGSTRLAQQMSGQELAAAVSEFESAAYDLAFTHDGRVVKFVGDEAMFVHLDPANACATALDLRDMVSAHPTLTTARCAASYGQTVAQDGDYYGSTVNVAARLVSMASPGSLLGTAELQEAVAAQSTALSFEPAGAFALRGFDRPVRAYAVSRHPTS